MKKRETRQGQTERGKRHPLLLQQQLNEQSFWPSILILAVSAALLIWNPTQAESYRPYLVLLVLGSGLILIATYWLRLRAYAQCRVDGLHVQLPFQRMTIPYEEMNIIRPTELYRMFPPMTQRWTQRSFLKPLFGKTVLVVEMDKLPRSRAWLRLWLSPYMVCPDAEGLVIPVRDWMAFRTDLDEYRARYHRIGY
jgi:hypothetical protein